MDITLRFNGAVPSGQDGSKHSDFKQKLRLQISNQLRRHWKKGLLHEFYERGLPKAHYERHSPCRLLDAIDDFHPFFKVEVCGFSAIPLVSWHNLLGCELEFVFLGDERGAIDLDNQIKVLFDALRMPQHDGEVPGHMHGHGEDLFCLLEDDSIVRKYSVESAFGGHTSPPEEELTIKVRIGHSRGVCHPALERLR